MKSFRMAILLVITALVFPSGVAAQNNSIYSWTDENGVKHFSDRAPANVEAHRQEMVKPNVDNSADTDNPADASNSEPMDDTTENTAENPTASPGQGSAAEELSYADQQRLEIAQRREAERKKQAEREQLCLQARDRLARIEPNRRVFYTDEDGNTTRMDDEERVGLVEESKNQVAEFCD